MRPRKERSLVWFKGLHRLDKSLESFLVQILIITERLITTSLHGNQVAKLLDTNLFMTLQLRNDLRIVRILSLGSKINQFIHQIMCFLFCQHLVFSLKVNTYCIIDTMRCMLAQPFEFTWRFLLQATRLPTLSWTSLSLHH